MNIFLFLPIFVALGYALGNILDKVVLSEYIESPYTRLFFQNTLTPVFTLFYVFFADINLISLELLALSALSGGIFFVASYLQYKATSLGEVSDVSLALKTISPLTLVFSIFFLAATLGTNQYLGLGLILAATVLVSLEKPSKQFKSLFKFTDTIKLGFASAFVFAISFTIIEYLTNHISFWNVFFWQQIGSLPLSLVLLRKTGVREESRKVLSRGKNGLYWLTGAVLAYLAANTVNVLAIEKINVSIATAITGISPIFVLILIFSIRKTGIDYFEETLSRSEIVMKSAATLLFALGLFFLNI